MQQSIAQKRAAVLKIQDLLYLVFVPAGMDDPEITKVQP